MKSIDSFLDRLNRAFWSLLPSCQTTIYMISLDLDKQLPWYKRLQVRIHYQFCIYTQRYAEQLKGMQRFLRTLDEGNYRLFDHQTLSMSRKAELAAKLRAATTADAGRSSANKFPLGD